MLAAGELFEIGVAALQRDAAAEPAIDHVRRDTAELDGAAAPAAEQGLDVRALCRRIDQRMNDGKIARRRAMLGFAHRLGAGFIQAGQPLLVELRSRVLPAGIGIYEALMTAVLVATGIPAGLSIPVTLMYRVLNMTTQLTPGYYFYQKAVREGLGKKV